MATFTKSFNELLSLKFDTIEKIYDKENISFFGIIKSQTITWDGWKFFNYTLKKYNNNLEFTVEMLFENAEMQKHVQHYYKTNFWDKLKLDKVESQEIANIIFVFAVQTSVVHCTKLIQKLLCVTINSVLTDNDIKKINAIPVKNLSTLFSVIERNSYENK